MWYGSYMLKFLAIITSIAALWLPGVAQAHRTPMYTHAQALQVAREHADAHAAALNAYWFRVRTDRFISKDRFAYYLRWNGRPGQVCKLGRVGEPQIVVNRYTGAVRELNFSLANVDCSPHA